MRTHEIFMRQRLKGYYGGWAAETSRLFAELAQNTLVSAMHAIEVTNRGDTLLVVRA
jgi:hypothetical protein